MFARIVWTALLLSLPLTLPAQLAGTIADPRLKKLIEATKLKYRVNSAGNVLITYNVDSAAARTHQVIVYSRSEEMGGFEVRECRLYAARLDILPTQEQLFELMKQSYTQKLGAWEMDFDDGKYYVFYNLKVPVEIDAKAFREILGSFVGIVDAWEVKLTGGQDEF